MRHFQISFIKKIGAGAATAFEHFNDSWGANFLVGIAFLERKLAAGRK